MLLRYTIRGKSHDISKNGMVDWYLSRPLPRHFICCSSDVVQFFLQEKSPRSKSGSMKRNNSMTRLPDEVSTSVQDFCVLQIRPVFFRLLSFFLKHSASFLHPKRRRIQAENDWKVRFTHRIYLQDFTGIDLIHVSLSYAMQST